MNKKVLVVDDNQLMLDFLSALLETRGCQVNTAQDGLEALNLLTTFKPDIIFVDLVMPRIDGDKLCRIIRKMPHLDDCFLVLMSAAAAEADIDFGLIGANFFMAKGPNDKMIQSVGKILATAANGLSGSFGGDPYVGMERSQPRQIILELLSKTRHLESILENIFDGLVEVYADRMVYANTAARSLLGLAAEELLGQSFMALFDTGQREAIQRLRRSPSVAAGLLSEPTSISVNQRFVLVRILPMPTSEPTEIFFLSDQTEAKASEDALKRSHQELETMVAERTAELESANRRLSGEIAERRESESALARSRQQFYQFMRNLPAMAFIKDAEGRYVYANEAFRVYFGIDPESLLGTTDADQWPPEIAEELKKHDDTVFQTGRVLNTIERVRIGEDVRYLLVAKFPFDRETDEPGLAGIALDITDRQKSEDEKKRLTSRLQRARKMEAVGSLAGGLAHDLNNILSGLVSYPELLLMDMPPEHPFRGPLMTIRKSGEQAASVVQDMLTLSRSGLPDAEPTRLNDIVAEYLADAPHRRLMVDVPGLTVETRLAADLTLIRGAKPMLRKILELLVANAVFSAGASGTIRITTADRCLETPLVVYETIREGHYVTLTIEDSGPAMSAEDQERFFEPFYTKKIMGRPDSGIALPVVWGTVKDHEGAIDIRCDETQGNTITLFFPALADPSDPTCVPEKTATIMGRGESILVVEDAREQREVATSILQRLGYRVTAVPSGEAAIRYMEAGRVDLLVLDMIMEPGITGLETYRRVLLHHPGQRAIFVSDFADNTLIEEARSMGAAAYIKKPYELDKIGTAVRGALDR